MPINNTRALPSACNGICTRPAYGIMTQSNLSIVASKVLSALQAPAHHPPLITARHYTHTHNPSSSLHTFTDTHLFSTVRLALPSSFGTSTYSWRSAHRVGFHTRKPYSHPRASGLRSPSPQTTSEASTPPLGGGERESTSLTRPAAPHYRPATPCPSHLASIVARPVS